MRKRLVKIRTLVKQDRRCRAMVWIGAKPQGTWGHQGGGLAPSTVLKLRQQFAGAAMLRRPGGCTTTAYGMTVGLAADPTITLRVELMQSWLEIAAKPGVPHTALAKVWRRKQTELAGPGRWSKVRGPMSAVIATLQDMRWQPVGPTSWVETSPEYGRR